MTPCPSDETLAQFLAGAAPEECAALVREHVRACVRCQGLLDRLSDDAQLRSWVPRARGAAIPGGDGPALEQVLRQLGVASTNHLASNTPSPGPHGSLSFLAPARRVGDVGTLGAYAIEAQVGRGGMGIVLRGYDETLKRIVALKVLRPELADQQARARFVREAQATARIDHNHVVRIYSVVNPPEGLPYLVMEYAAGPSLAQLIRTEQRLEPERAVHLIAQAAEGLAAAHAAGLIHRDIKPGNILLDPVTGRAKITDFGLARIAAMPHEWTKDLQLAGTPMYMSPEQAQGLDTVDARTDIYSLGVTLYEALTGEVPFRGAPHMVLKQVMEEDARPPRSLNDRIPADVQTICLKAMTKEPPRRYQTARQLADDLRRWQRGEPIQARPAGVVERGWRWCRRNQRVASLSAAVLGLLIAVATGSLTAALWIGHAKTIADRERQAAESARIEADENALAAQRAQEQAAANARAAGAHFTVALDAMNALVGKVQQQLGNQPGTLLLRRELVENAIAGLDKIAASAAKNPSTDRIMVVAHHRMGELFNQLGRTDRARQHFDQARILAETLIAADPQSVEPKQDLARCQDRLGDLALVSRDFPVARGHYQAALNVRQVLAESASPPRLSWRDLAVSHNKLGDVSFNAGDAAAARTSYQTALDLCEKNAATTPDQVLLLSDLRFGYGRLGDARQALYDFEGAAACYAKSLQKAEALLTADTGNVFRKGDVALSHSRLGHVNLRLADYATAEEHYRKALAIWQTLATADAQNAVAQRNLAAAYSNLGDAAICNGNLPDAREFYVKALTLCEELAQRDPASAQRLDDALVNCVALAAVEERAERYSEAAEWHQRALAAYRRLEAAGGTAKGARQHPQQQFADGLRLYTAAARHGINDLEWIVAQQQVLAHGLLRLRGLTLARRGQHREAADTAEKLTEREPKQAASLMDAARIYARCAQAAGDKVNERQLHEQYANRAIDALREAARLDPFSPGGLFLEPDLIPLFRDIRWKNSIQGILRPKTVSAKS
jgi:tetratricopeptide (TPR) repeat protein/tRNA A-37 threonylcarbamoyl transferase component Bud32